MFTRLADRYPDHELTANGLFLAASAAVRDEAWDIAESLYARIAELSAGDDQAAAWLWLGRIALNRGDGSAANEAFDKAIAAAPDSYFAARAGDFRIGRQPFQAPELFQFDFDDSVEQAAAEDWLAANLQSGSRGRIVAAFRNLGGRSAYDSWTRAVTVGAVNEAFVEFEDLVGAAREAGDVLSSYRLAIYLRGLGLYRESIIAAADVIIASGQGTLQVPGFIARMRFPAYYIDVVQPAAQERGIDPLLMLSLIRQESLFNTYATAAAGEKA